MNILISKDIVTPKPFVPWKSKVKRILQALGFLKSPHGSTLANSFFPCLYVTPVGCNKILLILNSKLSSPILSCYINGKKTDLEPLGENKYFSEKDHFYAYENILSFNVNDAVTSIELFPVISCSKFQKKFILSRNYQVKSFENNVFTPIAESKNCNWACDKNNKILKEYLCILHAHIKDENCEFRGLYYPAYDLNNRSYRLTSWVWTNAIIVKTFLSGTNRNKALFEKKAKTLVDRILDFQVLEGDNFGSFMARWDILNNSLQGITPQLATNDSAFIGANALLPAYHYFKDQKYLTSAIYLGDWLLDKGMKKDGQLLIGFREDTKEWEDKYLFVDAGFTGAFLANLYQTTKNKKWLDGLTLFLSWYIKNLFDFKQHFFRWNWYSYRSSRSTMFSRGQAWAMDGLLSALEVTGNEDYLNVLEKVSQTLMNHQTKEGYWYYHMNDPKSGCCSKGTPIIAYHLCRLYQFNKDVQILKTVEKAMSWCENAICTSENDKRAFGGICGESEEGTMYGARNIKSLFLYSTCYYILLSDKLKDLEND